MSSPALDKLVKTLTLTIVGVGLFAMISVVFLVGYSVHRINQAIPLQPDPDLTALEQLLTRKLLVLTREQKKKLAPIVRDLTQEGNVPENVKRLKVKMWEVLDSRQIKSIEDWKGRASKQAGDLMQKGDSELRGTVEKYKADVKRELTDQYGSIDDRLNSITERFGYLREKFNSKYKKYNSLNDNERLFNRDTVEKDNLLKLLE